VPPSREDARQGGGAEPRSLLGVDNRQFPLFGLGELNDIAVYMNISLLRWRWSADDRRRTAPLLPACAETAMAAASRVFAHLANAKPF
jgi:hypothetical protein